MVECILGFFFRDEVIIFFCSVLDGVIMISVVLLKFMYVRLILLSMWILFIIRDVVERKIVRFIGLDNF